MRVVASITTLTLLLTGCVASTQSREPHYFVQRSMGVKVELRIDEPDEAVARTAAMQAFARIDALDALWSDWRTDSELTRFNATQRAESIAVSPETGAAVALALEVAFATDGVFDPTIAPLVALWRASRASLALPNDEALRAARARVNFKHIESNGIGSVTKIVAETALDLGGIGKGLAAAELVVVLANHGCPRALVSVAGDIAAGEAPIGSTAWTVDIQWKNGTREAIELLRQSASTSGDSEQFVEINGTRYAHIIDPKTGLGAINAEQVTVIGPQTSSEELLAATITDPHSFISNGGRVDAFATALSTWRSEQLPREIPHSFRVIKARSSI